MTLPQSFEGKFDGKTIFVTGHTGIIGSWLSLWLKKIGANVIGFSKEIHRPSLFDEINLENDVKHITGDINNLDEIKLHISNFKPDIVFHLAAQPLVIESYKKPIETIQTNVMGTANILESIRYVKSVKVCIVMTSDKCYANREIDYAYKESDPLGGHDTYSASKGAAELITSAFRSSFFNSNKIQDHNISVSSVRAGNVICGGDWAKDRIIPDCIRALIENKPILIRYPNSIRPWQHVLEPVSGMLCLASKMLDNPSKFADAWNFGPEITRQKVSVRELAEIVIKKWGGGSLEIDKEKLQEKHEANLLMLDSSKAINQLEWFPVFSLQEAIDATVAWYQSFVKKDDMKKVTYNQIETYVEKAKEMNISWAHSSV